MYKSKPLYTHNGSLYYRKRKEKEKMEKWKELVRIGNGIWSVVELED